MHLLFYFMVTHAEMRSGNFFQKLQTLNAYDSQLKKKYLYPNPVLLNATK